MIIELCLLFLKKKTLVIFILQKFIFYFINTYKIKYYNFDLIIIKYINENNFFIKSYNKCICFYFRLLISKVALLTTFIILFPSPQIK